MLPQVYSEFNIEEVSSLLDESSELPLLREYFFDFEKGSLVYEKGKPKILSGIEALKVQLHKALITERYKYLGYSWDYGSEITTLIGKVQSNAVMEAESKRLIEESLLVNPYVTSIGKVNVKLNGKKLTINAQVNTVYGEVEIDV